MQLPPFLLPSHVPFGHLPASLATHPLTWVVLFFALHALRNATLIVRLAGVSTCGLVLAVAGGWLPTLYQAEVAGIVTVLALLFDLVVGLFTEATQDLASVGQLAVAAVKRRRRAPMPRPAVE